MLPSTPGDRKAEIQRAIAELQAGGSTNGAAGIQLAYDIASAGLHQGRRQPRHPRDRRRLQRRRHEPGRAGPADRARSARRGVFLSVLGFGTGNLKDSTMEKLADKGNGNYAYIDSLHEARRVLVAEAGATLVTVAKDVKIQVEFNPRDGRRVPADRLREPAAAAPGLQRRQEGRGRDRRRPHGDGALRDRPAG